MKKKSGQFYNLQFTIYNRRKAAFTLVEILIVAAILGILAAIVLPEFQTHAAQAKEAAAKDNLRVLRETIERYAAEHNDVAPGHPGNSPTAAPSSVFFNQQVIGTGKYLPVIPKNPFNDSRLIYFVPNATDMPADAIVGFGWVYKASTKNIRLSQIGSDSQNVRYYDY